MHPTCYKTILSVFRMAERHGDVGVEIEVEGDNLPANLTGWERKEERSLRGEAAEYVTRGPVTLDALKERLLHLSKYLTREGTRVRLTGRASTHIHLNLQHHTFRTMFGTLLVAVAVEPLMLLLCGPQRNGNLFCLPTSETHDLPRMAEIWADVLAERDIGRHMWAMRGKYAAINTDPIPTLGTIEFRCFPNSITPDEIHRWATWVVKIRDYAFGFPNENYDALFDALYDDPSPLVDIFRNDPTVPHLLRDADAHEHGLVRSGIETAYETYRAIRPLLVFKTPKKEKRKKVPTMMHVLGEPNQVRWNDLVLANVIPEAR